MKEINWKVELNGDFEKVIERVTEGLKPEGFGVLTRIDLHTKLKEKLDKDLEPAVILGACNPQLAFDAYRRNPDVAGLLPCNVVVRKISTGRQSVEFIKPSSMIEALGDPELTEMARSADQKLKKVVDALKNEAQGSSDETAA